MVRWYRGSLHDENLMVQPVQLQSSMIFVLKFLRTNMFEDQYEFKEQFEWSMRDIQDIMKNFGKQCYVNNLTYSQPISGCYSSNV